MRDPERSHAPIGIFDSGIGGLSVAHEIALHLPQESLVYLADTAHVPYGERSDAQIRELTRRAAAWLSGRGCKTMVVACNTASAFSLTALREHYGDGLPIVGLVPAVKPAALATRSGKIGVLATPGTLRGDLLREVIAREAVPRGVEVLMAVSPALVPLIEAGQQDSAACREELARVLDPLMAQGIDQLVLGCTHYPFLKGVLGQMYGAALTLVDSGAAVARQTGRILAARGWLATHEKIESAPEAAAILSAPVRGKLDFFATGCTPAGTAVLKQWWPEAASVQTVQDF